MDRLVDFFHLAWGLIYWNVRKTHFRLQKNRGLSPCQHPSDSGAAWETSCHAVIHWRKPARFRRVCPHFQRDRSGEWRCAINRAEVRPLWRRAAAYYLGAIGLFYLTATLSVFIVMRSTGYPVRYSGVLWPPAWSQFQAVRAEFFLDKSRRAFAAHDINGAILSLSLAYDLDPHNYASGRLLAQLWQVGQPSFSDRVYQRLLTDHPAHAEETAQAWLRALLPRGDFRGVQALAAARLLDPATPAVWLNAFLFANHPLADTEAAPRLLTSTSHPTLSPSVRAVLTLDAELTKLSRHEARARLLQRAPHEADAYYVYFVARELIARGAAQDALNLVETSTIRPSAHDVITLRLDALAALGGTTTRQAAITTLLTTTPSAPAVEIVSNHLIRYPDRATLALLFNTLKTQPLPATTESYPAYLALYCAAGVEGDKPNLTWTATRLKTIAQADFAALDAVGAFFLERRPRDQLGNFLPALQPLALETAYALFEHYAPPVLTTPARSFR
jgi:hypothetical protein